ncbi:protein, partial [Polypterus senegalus]
MWFYGTKKYDVTSDRETTVYHTNEWEVPSSYRHRVQFLGNRNKKCSINISNVSREDSGFYTFGVQKYSSGYYYWTFEPGVHVTITGLKIEATAKNVKENDPVTLRCKMNCSLYGSVFWFRNGRRLNHTSAELKIQRASYEDHGNFSCQNDNFTSPEFLLNVEYGRKNAIIAGQANTTIEEGESVTLNCTASTNPPSKYTWVKENSSHVGSGEHLHISAFNVNDAGSYHCEASNSHRTAKSAAVKLTVSPLKMLLLIFLATVSCVDDAPKNAIITREPTTCAQERKSVTLNCKASANPPSNYVWVKENSSHVGSGEHLHISAFNVNDAGSYHCEATNIHGTAKSAAVKLTSYYENSIHNTGENTVYHTNVQSVASRYRNRVQFLGDRNKICSVRISDVRTTDSGYYKFRFVGYGDGLKWTGVPGVRVTVTGLKIKATAQTVKENDEVTLTSTTTCSLTNGVFWYRNEQRLRETSQTLVIQRVSYEDHGSYWCQTGVTKSPAYQLNIVYAPKNVVISGLPTICIEEGTSVTLHCTAIANPPGTYTWVKDNIRIPGSGEHLQISRASVRAAGSYHCEVTNIYGMIKSAAVTLVVNHAPKNAVITGQANTTIEEGESVTLNCTASANPPSNYTWVKENSSHVGSGEHLKISEFNVNDAGSYHCEATNIHGTAKSATVKLTVNVPPNNTTASLNYTTGIKDGDPVALICSSSANPLARYSWFKITEAAILLMGSERSLTLTAVTPSDSGRRSTFYITKMSTFGILIFLLSLFQCSCGQKFYATMPSNIQALTGSCLVIPCSFTSPQEGSDPMGIWRINHYWSRVDVFKGNQSLNNWSGLKVTILGDLKLRNCTTLLDGIGPDNQGVFYFRIEDTYLNQGKSFKYSFTDGVQINITVPPTNTTARLNPTGDVRDGDQVALICNSSANPAANYTWFRANGAAISPTGSGQILTLTAVTPGDSGRYYCQAQNQYGEDNSSVTTLDVRFSRSDDCILPLQMTTLSGSCLLIPCTFGPRTPSSGAVGVWNIGFKSQTPVSRGNTSLERWANVKVSLLGDVTQRNCTTLLENLSTSNTETYYFRVESDSLKYGYAEGVHINILDSPNAPLLNSISPVEENLNISLNCSSPLSCPTQPPILTWSDTLNGTVLQNITSNNGSQSLSSLLTFRASYQLDMKSISCTVWYPVGTENRNAPKNTGIIANTSTDILEGSTVNLQCTSNANPVSNYTWFKVNGSSELLTSFGQNLTIKTVSRSDNGVYLCRAQNGFGHGNSSVTLNVQYPPKETTAHIYPAADIMEGTQVILSCISVINPSGNYTWFKGNGSDATRRAAGQNLSISAVTLGDSGVYYCQADNQYGGKNSTAVTLRIQLSRSDDCTLPAQMTTLSGSCLLIPCTFGPRKPSSGAVGVWNIGFPFQTQVSRGNTSLNGWSKVQVSLLGDVTQGNCTTLLKNLSTSNTETYYFRVESGNFTYNYTEGVQIDVSDPPKETTAHIYPAADIMEGTQVILSCISVINPSGNYTWFKGNRSDATRRAAGQNLSISAVTLGDSGVYYCQADNQYGGKNSTAVTLRIQLSRSDDCILPLQMTTLSGSCLLIPCTFGPRTPSSGAVGVWNIGFTSQTPVSRGNTSQNGWSNVKVSLLGDVTQRNCTTLLENLSTSNTETYYFRVESDSLKFSYAEGVHINVLDSPDAPLLSSTSPVKENLNISLNCSSPLSCPTQPPILTWSDTLNGMVLQNITSNNGSQSLSSLLTFRASYELDMKNISCTVWYPVGTENRSASASVLLQVWYRPRNTSAVTNVHGVIPAGTSVTLSCTSKANPPATYTWFKVDGPSDSPRGLGQQLLIRKATQNDSGSYVCQAENPYGRENSTALTLEVVHHPRNTSAVTNVHGVISAGTSVTLSCTSKANPPANYTWFKVDGPSDSPRGFRQELLIRKATQTDSGSYVCQAENQYGRENSTALTLEVMCVGSQWTVWMPKVMSTMKSSCIVIPCNFQYPPSVRPQNGVHGIWYFGDPYPQKYPPVVFKSRTDIVHESYKHRTKLLGDLREKNCTLQISNVGLEHGGKYFFRADLGGSNVYTYPDFSDVRVLDSPIIDEPEEIINEMAVTLSCSAPNNCPDMAPEVNWFNTEGLEEPLVTVKYIDDVDNTMVSSELSFVPSYTHNGKELGCKVHYPNSSLSYGSMIALDVKYPPREVEVNMSLEAMEGSTVVLHCIVDSNPPPLITWYLYDVLVKEEEAQNSTLVLENLQPSQEGIYTCNADNKYGEKNNSLFVAVKYPPREPSVNSSVTIQEGTTITLHCSSEGNPVPTLTWFRDGTLVSSVVSESQSILEIRDITFESDGNYRCLAENEHGRASSHVNVTVQCKDAFYIA